MLLTQTSNQVSFDDSPDGKHEWLVGVDVWSFEVDVPDMYNPTPDSVDDPWVFAQAYFSTATRKEVRDVRLVKLQGAQNERLSDTGDAGVANLCHDPSCTVDH